MQKKVADYCNFDVHRAVSLSVLEFMNYYAYCLDKERQELAELKRQQAEMKARARAKRH